MRVVIAEDSVLLREGLARLLAEKGFDVVGQCTTPDDLLLKVRSYAPDVAIVDIRLPPTHNDEGIRAARQIRTLHPSVGVLVLSQYVELGLAMKLLAESAEGIGYLLKDRVSDVKDSNGTVLHAGDNVTLIKDLKVKGTSVTLKRGTLVKNIRLTSDEGEIECNAEKVKGLVLKTEFLKKA